MLKIAKIYMPHLFNAEARVAHEALQDRLAAKFGGYTCYPANGGWVNPAGSTVQEPVVVYEFGVPVGTPLDKERSNMEIRKIAREFAERLDQHSFMTVDTDGVAHIKEVRHDVETS